MKKLSVNLLLGLLAVLVFSSCENEDSKIIENSDSDITVSTKLNPDILESVFTGLEKIEKRAFETRASATSPKEVEEVMEDDVREAISPLIEDGEYIRQQVLAQDDLTEEDREVISHLDEGQLALASFTLNILIDEDEPGYNNKMECLTSAIGGGFTSGGIIGGGINGILYGVTARAVLLGFGTTIGGVVFAGMVIYSYQQCRSRK